MNSTEPAGYLRLLPPKHFHFILFTRDEYDYAFAIAIQHHQEFLRKLSNRLGREVEALVEVALESVS